VTRTKVAIATHFPADPESPRGGVEAVSVNLVRSLASFDDLDVHVVTLHSGVMASAITDWYGARLHRLPRQGGSELANATGAGRRQIHAYLRSLAPDVVHAHDTYGLMVKGLDLPRVFTIHGFIYGDTLVSGEKFPWLRSQLWKRVETSGWADQPHIVSISPYVRERLAGIATGVIHDIDNPIGEAFFSLPRQEQPTVIFSAAAICTRKNTLSLVHALHRLARCGIDAELRLAGPITDAAYGVRLKSAVRDYGLQDRVVLLGQIGTQQIRHELTRAAIFALVSLEENSPMGIEEAMAVGVPVVTSNRCGMPYMVRHAETGFLVDPHDVEDIARRLQTLLQSPSMRSAMGAKAQAIAADRFHPSGVAARTRLVYQDAMATHASMRAGSSKL
jgi:glycosyltransferase involved in cell wall biosynthesis